MTGRRLFVLIMAAWLLALLAAVRPAHDSRPVITHAQLLNRQDANLPTLAPLAQPTFAHRSS